MNSYFNCTDTQVVYDDEGRIVAGGETLNNVQPTKQIDRAVEQGRLINTSKTEVESIPVLPIENGSLVEEVNTPDHVVLDKSTDSDAATSTQTAAASDATEPDAEKVSEDAASTDTPADETQTGTTTSKKRGN